MAGIIIVGGRAINMDHVTTANWNEGTRELSLVFNQVEEVHVSPFGNQSTSRYTYKTLRVSGDEAEALWDKIEG
jgi:hypothetical protein